LDPILAGIAAGAAARVVDALIPQRAVRAGFAEVLRAQMEDSRPRPCSAERHALQALFERIRELPLTSREAREVSMELQALLSEAAETGTGAGFAARLERALADFVERVSRRYLLSENHKARLGEIVFDWAGQLSHGAAGLKSDETLV